jgi:dephospho-CoA kinase
MPDGLLRVGLTGGIATGKSYVRQRLEEAGLPTIDADRLAREAVSPGSTALRAVIDRFGRDILTEAGTLDRAKLGALVFRDGAARADLEAIIHPDVRQRIADWQAGLVRGGYRGPVVADIPLLFETGRTRDFDVIVVVACDPERQRTRLMARDGLTEDDADRRLQAQWPIADKVRAADYVVKTDGTFGDTDAQVDALAARLRSGQVSGDALQP